MSYLGEVDQKFQVENVDQCKRKIFCGWQEKVKLQALGQLLVP